MYEGMDKMPDILFKTDDYIFSYRVGGVLIHKDKMLFQRVPGDDGYAFIGGHVAFGETTIEALVREFKEEICADIKVERLLMVVENFFPWGPRSCHQINLLYLVSLIDETQIPLEGSFKAVDELGNERIDLDMCWIPLKDLPNITVYPIEAKKHIVDIPNEIVHFVYKE